MNVQPSATLNLNVESLLHHKGPAVELAASNIHVLPAKQTISNFRRMEIVTDAAQMAALAAEWIDLETFSTRAISVFQTYVWSMAFASAAAGEAHAPKLVILSGWEGNRLDFLMPLVSVRIGPVRCLRWLTDPYGQYGDILLRDGSDAEEWLNLALATLRKNIPGDALQLRHVRDDSVIAPWLRIHGKSSEAHHGAPSMDLRQFKSEADLDLTLNKEQRRRRRRVQAGLESMGTLEFTSLTGPEAEAAIDEAIAVKRDWIGERGLWTDAVNQPCFNAMLKKACSLSGQGTLNMVVTRTTAGGRPVAWEIGMRTVHRHFVYLTAYTADVASLSPARFHMDASLRNAINAGLENFDLMIPNDPYKASWSNNVVSAEDYYLALTMRGKLYSGLWLGLMRPFARKVYHGSPDWPRRVFTRLARHILRA